MLFGNVFPRGVTTSAKTEELFSVLTQASLNIEQCVSDCNWKLCLSLSVISDVLPKSSWLCFLVKHFSTREIKIIRDALCFLEILKTTLDMRACSNRSTLTRLLLAVLPNINYSMMLSLTQGLINKLHVLFGF